MRYRELITEMPELIDATDFNLMAPEVNAKLAEKLLAAPNREMIAETADYILFRTGKDRGNIALITKPTNRVDYWVRFSTIQKKLVGRTVTQVMLWRNNRSPHVQGITQKMFFGYLLKHWPTIMSDAQQTPQGKEFWVRMMVNAAERGLKVGLADMNAQSVEWFDRTATDITSWLDDHSSAWSPSKNDQGKRFLISKI